MASCARVPRPSPGSVALRQAEELASRYPNTIPLMLDVSAQDAHLDSLFQDHQVVIR